MRQGADHASAPTRRREATGRDLSPIAARGEAGQAPLFLVLASWLLGSAKFACLQRQKPAMFAQIPLCVYRHFTGAVCTTSSDGRFASFSLASRLSNSSDMVRSRTSRSRRLMDRQCLSSIANFCSSCAINASLASMAAATCVRCLAWTWRS